MSREKQNIVLVSIDSLRADHCGFLGDGRGLTPAMDALATDGASFASAVAPGPQTFSSMPAAFTGYPRAPGAVDEYEGDTHWERRLAAIDDHLDRHASLPERLRELGYTTAGFSPNPWTSSASGFDRGFDRFEDFSGEGSESRLRDIAERLPLVDTDSKAVELGLDMLTGSSFFARWESFYDQVNAVREQLPEPYFLWVFLLDTHYPFLTGRSNRSEQSLLGMYSSAIRSEKAMRGGAATMPASVRESMCRSYRDTVRSVDSFVESFHEDSAEDDPALIVHSDHGESFGEHGNYGHHHRQLYEENVHVPYFVHNAGSSATVDEPTSLSTIPKVALSIARDGPFDPRSVTGPSAVSTSECGVNRAVRDRRFKYMESEDQTSLFDLLNDPGEHADVSESHGELCRKNRARLESFEGHCRETVELSDAAETVAGLGAL